MTYLPPLPNELQQVEYVKLYFHLQVSHFFNLPQLGLLQLRRELLQALHVLEGWEQTEETVLLRCLLQPDVSSDPVQRQQVQKPSPAFVLSPPAELHGAVEAGQRIVLPALFIGLGVQCVNAFVSLLQQLGQQGLYHGTGQFALEGVESEDASGTRAMLWSFGQSEPLSPPVSDLHWWLEKQLQPTESLLLDVITPLRILKNKRPLFKAGFSDILPFVLRRITAVLASHAGVDAIADQYFYLNLAKKIRGESDSLHWQDWRQLSGEHRSQDLGGLVGTLALQGADLPEFLWLLQLASLLNLGKGSTYGAGQIRLRTS